MAIRTLNRFTSQQVAGMGDGNHNDGGGLFFRADGPRRSWIFRYSYQSKVHEMGLGSVAAVSLKQARVKRDALRALIDQGVNPLAERRRRQAEESAKKTVAEVAAAYVTEKRAGWSASHCSSWRRFATSDIAPIAALAIDDIGRDDLALAITPFVNKGALETARLTQSRLHALLDFAGEHGWRSADKRTRWSSVAPPRRQGEQPHFRSLKWPEAPSAVARIRSSVAMSGFALEFVVLTASRLSEAAGAQWDEIDLAGALWVVPATRMKRGIEHVVPLSPRALEILRALHARRGPGQRLVFPGRGDRRPLNRHAIAAQNHRATEGRATVHGWRSSFSSWCAAHAVDFEVREACLAHSSNAVVAAYQRDGLIERRRVVMDRWAQFLAGEAAVGEVIPMTRRA